VLECAAFLAQLDSEDQAFAWKLFWDLERKVPRRALTSLQLKGFSQSQEKSSRNCLRNYLM